MTLRFRYMASALALTGSTLAYAQTAQPPAQSSTQQTTSTTTQQTPDQTKTTTTRSTLATQPAPDQGQTTTTQSTSTTATQPATSDQGSAAAPAASTTTTTTTTATAQPTAATAADVKAGVSVYDQKGGLVGKVESVSAKGAVVSTGTVKASIPVSSFAKGDKGLIISMTKAELDASAKQKTATTTKTAKKPK